MVKKKTHCIFCSEEVNSTSIGGYKIIALEKPYINLYVHPDCYKQLIGDLHNFLQKNLQEYIENLK